VPLQFGTPVSSGAVLRKVGFDGVLRDYYFREKEDSDA
jgi:hypothetical protein